MIADRRLADLEMRLACENLVTAYAHHIDLGDAAAVADLFTEDGEWHGGDIHMEGAAEIKAGFGRRAGLDRRSAHVCTNVAISPDGPDAADGVCYFTLYRHDGGGDTRAPAPLAGPVMVGVYRDRFVRTADGWRIKSRVAEARFAAQTEA